ncbi:hypothetical protein EMCG_04633 [[Emmonsia] crescens]|uniref:Uncharacterized protein n=1 Tax=[Emmonsia] crescens TaxID=73230 RepID=A0A0G2J794_9EURO|nr:hypothetical protein EMCG_04633 [Emmonsia crescens UAMH 3008]
MAPCNTLIAPDISGCLSDSRTSRHLLDDRISRYITDTDWLRSLTPAPSPSSLSPFKGLPARAESIGFVFATTTLTVTVAASPGVLLSSYAPSSSTHASFTPSSSIISNSTPLSSTLPAPAPSSTKTTPTSRHPRVTGSAVSISECSGSKGVPTPILVLLIIMAVVAVMMSLAIWWVRRSRKFCRQCKAAILSQTLTKQTPPTNDYGSQPLSELDSQPSMSERIRGMAASVLSLNTQLARPHIRDADQGNPQWALMGDNISLSPEPQNAAMAPRISQLNWKPPRPNSMDVYSSASASGGEVRRGHASISVASIIDKYAQVPDENRYRDTSQATEDHRILGNTQNLRCDGNLLVDLRSGSLRRRMRDNGLVVDRDYILSEPTWKHPQPNETDNATSSSSPLPIEPWVQGRRRQESNLEMPEFGRSRSVSRDGLSPIAQYKGLWTQTPKHARQERQSESSYNPIHFSFASQPSSMTSLTSTVPARDGNVSDHFAPNFIAGPSRNNHAPSDATHDSDDNLSRMLKRWAFLDQQNIGLVDRVPIRPSSARDRLNGYLNSKLKPCALSVRRSMSTPPPGILSKLPLSVDRRAEKAENAEILASKYSRKKLVLEEEAVGSAHYGNYISINQYREAPHDEEDGGHFHDRGFGKPYFQQRTYSESFYSRPTTLQRVPQDWQAVDEEYSGQGYSSPQHYGQQTYRSPKAGPSQPILATSFHNEDDDDSGSPRGCEYRYCEPDGREHLARRKPSELSLSERGTIRDNAIRRHMRDMRAAAADELPDSGVTANHDDADGPGESRRGSFIRGFVDIYGGMRKKKVVGEGSKRRSSFLDLMKLFQY